jgi:hypothetical protein
MLFRGGSEDVVDTSDRQADECIADDGIKDVSIKIKYCLCMSLQQRQDGAVQTHERGYNNRG